MLVAVKGNREEKIDEKQKDVYLKNGYDVLELDDENKVINRTISPSKKVPYTQYKAVLDENMALKEENKKLKAESKLKKTAE